MDAVKELEQKEEQLNSWNRRGGPKCRGGSKVEMVFFDSNYHPVATRHPSCPRRGVELFPFSDNSHFTVRAYNCADRKLSELP